MESTKSCWDDKFLIMNQLTQWKEQVKELQMHLDPNSSTGPFLITKLLSSFDNSLLMLNSLNSQVEPQMPRAIVVPIVTTESPRSMISGSPQSDFEGGVKSKKRKTMPSWTEQVRDFASSGLDHLDDGHSWRKYGQKDILGAKHPRGYYRCTHRNVQGCLAIKQVQRSDEDSSVFMITYRGRHTCNQASNLSRGQSSYKQEHEKQNQESKKRKTEETLIDFQTRLEVKTEDLDSSPFSFPATSSPINNSLDHENNIFSSLTHENNFMGSLSPPFMSTTPTTPESNYFSPYGMNTITGQNLQTSDSDLNEIISAVTSASNSPILDLDLDLGLDFEVDFDSSFFN